MPPERYIIHLDARAETLGSTLRRLRDERGWTQMQVAALLDPERADDAGAMKNMQALLSRYESDGVKRPDEVMLERFERIYDLPEDSLIVVANRAARQRRVRIPPNSVAVPGEPQLIKLLEGVQPLEDDELQAVNNLIESFTAYVRESEPTAIGMTPEERIANYQRFLAERANDATA